MSDAISVKDVVDQPVEDKGDRVASLEEATEPFVSSLVVAQPPQITQPVPLLGQSVRHRSTNASAPVVYRAADSAKVVVPLAAPSRSIQTVTPPLLPSVQITNDYPEIPDPWGEEGGDRILITPPPLN